MPTIRKLRSIAARVQRRVERTIFPVVGNAVECPFCGWTGWRFLTAGLYRHPNRLCPSCGSLERYRMLPLLLDRELGSGLGGERANGRSVRVLELAPKRCLVGYCKRRGWSYASSDLDSAGAMVRGDLRRMPFADRSFDLIVCMHVMEHIHEDGPAFAELARMLRPDGLAVICVPLRGEVTQEGAPKADWERLYGQDDHVRYYGMDIEPRMQAAGLTARRIDALQYFTPSELDRHALRGDDRYLFLASPQARA